MSNFKDTSLQRIYNVDENEKDEEEKKKSSIKTGKYSSMSNSVKSSIDQASRTFEKPSSYTGNRKLYDSGVAKKNVKSKSFSENSKVIDPYTGDELLLRKADAKRIYGNDWQKHLAEGDHINPIEKVYDKCKNNPWLTNDDIKDIANSEENLQTVSRKFNNAKRSRTNEEFVNDENYLKKTGVEINEDGKRRAIESGEKSQIKLNQIEKVKSKKRILETGHNAGKDAAKNSGMTAITMSGIMNITSVIKGEKTAQEAIKDTAVDGGKAAVTGYVMGNGLTVVSHSLSASSSKFISALSSANVPAKAISAVTLMGNTFKRYGQGEITTQECIIELGEKGVNLATTGYSMAVGQALIPVPVVGAAVGALVGSMLTSKYYNELVSTLKRKELEHQERQRIMFECKIAQEQIKLFRAEMESYLKSYFKDYQDCFDDALLEMQISFQMGDADGMILGANKITKKLGGKVNYESVEEFKDFLNTDSIDIL